MSKAAALLQQPPEIHPHNTLQKHDWFVSPLFPPDWVYFFVQYNKKLLYSCATVYIKQHKEIPEDIGTAAALTELLW